MTVVMAFVFAAMGAPGVFSLFAILTGVVFVVASLVSKERQERLAEEERMRAEEERARFSEEVAQTVKESLKGTIKVRCRYCGALSDENDEKCESCGAPL
jgi:rubrerythrin